jgi:hypothetical protein
LSRFDLSPFFLLSEPTFNACVADLDPDARYESQKIICPIFPGHRRSRRLSMLDVVVPCDSPPDVIFTWMSECLISARVKVIFQEALLTGFSTRPAKARLRDSQAAISVDELMITGWGGIAPLNSGIREVERCAGCGYLRYSGIEEPSNLIDSTNWDGSDFFMIWPLPRYRFVTRRVIEVCRNYGISGIEFSPNFPAPTDGVISDYSPGRLSYYMPSDRAQSLGNSFGIT